MPKINMSAGKIGTKYKGVGSKAYTVDDIGSDDGYGTQRVVLYLMLMG